MIASDTPPRELAVLALERLCEKGRLPDFTVRRREPALVRRRGHWYDELVFQRSQYSHAGWCKAWVHVTVARTVSPASGKATAKDRVVVGGNTLGRLGRAITMMPGVDIRAERFDRDVDELGALLADDGLAFLDQFDDTLRCVETTSPRQLANIWPVGIVPVARHLGRDDVLVRFYERRAHAEPYALLHICRGLAASDDCREVPGMWRREAELLRGEGLVELIPERFRAGWRGDERPPEGFLTRCPDIVIRKLHTWDLAHLADRAGRLGAAELRDIERRVVEGERAAAPMAGGKLLILEICAALGVSVDPAEVRANGTIHYPPE